MEESKKTSLSVDSDNEEEEKAVNLTEQEKQLRASLMQDIYNDMSSSSDEEE